MKAKYFWLLVFLLSVLMVLSACASNTSPEEPQEHAQPEEIRYRRGHGQDGVGSSQRSLRDRPPR